MLNMFIEPIYNKSKKNRFINWIKYRIFLRKLDKISPNFDILMQIADFCKILERVYMYDNSSKNELFSSNGYKAGENGFVLTKDGSDIKFKLYEEDKLIALEVSRNNGNKMKTVMKFHDEENILDNIHDEQLMINIVNWLMSAVKRLVIKYYNMKEV